MIQAHSSVLTQALPQQHARRVAMSASAFWMLFAALGVLLASIVAVAVATTPPAHAQLSSSSDVALVRDAVLARVSGSISDPLIEVKPGIIASSSNVRGLQLHGVTYYYSVSGAPAFDPLSIGRVAPEQTDVVLREQHDSTLLTIYRLR